MMPVAGKQPLAKIQALWFNSFVLSMTKINQLKTYEGGYHCGAVRIVPFDGANWEENIDKIRE